GRPDRRRVRLTPMDLFMTASQKAAAPHRSSKTGVIKGIKRLEDTVIRVPSVGDNWHTSWANDDRQYVSLCDGKGFPGMEQKDFNSRAYAIVGDPPSMKFEYLPGYPELVNDWRTRDTSRYYNFGILALDGTIYQYLSFPNVPFNEPAPRFV